MERGVFSMLSGAGLLPLTRANDLLFFCEKQHDLVHVPVHGCRRVGGGIHPRRHLAMPLITLLLFTSLHCDVTARPSVHLSVC